MGWWLGCGCRGLEKWWWCWGLDLGWEWPLREDVWGGFLIQVRYFLGGDLIGGGAGGGVVVGMKRLRFGEGVLGGKGVCFVDVIDFSHYKRNCECYSASHLLHMMCIFFSFFVLFVSGLVGFLR